MHTHRQKKLTNHSKQLFNLIGANGHHVYTAMMSQRGGFSRQNKHTLIYAHFLLLHSGSKLDIEDELIGNVRFYLLWLERAAIKQCKQV